MDLRSAANTFHYQDAVSSVSRFVFPPNFNEFVELDKKNSKISTSPQRPGTDVADGSATMQGFDHQHQHSGSDPNLNGGKRQEDRLLRNRSAAKECRLKKKEYVRCLEKRLRVLEDQNKQLIEQVKTLMQIVRSMAAAAASSSEPAPPSSGARPGSSPLHDRQAALSQYALGACESQTTSLSMKRGM